MIKKSLLALVVVSCSANAGPPLYGGYAIISEAPVGADLAQTVYVQVRGRTVLEGLLEILRGTGYRLAAEGAADPEIGRLYRQPYPEVQRSVGPVELGAALERLAGPAWRLVTDPVNRLVSFEVRPDYPTGPGAGAGPSADLAKPVGVDAVAGGPTRPAKGGRR